MALIVGGLKEANESLIDYNNMKVFFEAWHELNKIFGINFSGNR
jgi:hypothetical protein